MKAAIFLVLLVCVLLEDAGQPCAGGECGENECCAGGSYHRCCRRLGNDGEPCEEPNRFNSYLNACPCGEGLFCSVINRCQKP
uniref:Secretory peptide n=1 Tax=Heteropoda venatoria TaxID=152925 RepID=A0A088BPQ1_HETVE|nr:secretory peptide [Heteropoda venatoria]